MATLLQVKNINKAYDNHIILEDASLTIAEKEKVAVVGRNGAGKSTLFKIIVGEEAITSGEVQMYPNARVGYLTQHDTFEDGETIMEFLMRESGREDWECAKTAGQFELKGDMLYQPITSFAGGYQMRVKLINMLLKEPNLLLLDEPTNYLDLSTQILLERFLKNYNGGFMLISHDREFIKQTCTSTVEVEHGKIIKFPQSLEEYLGYKEEQLELKQKTNVKIEREKAHLQKFVTRFGAKASKASAAQSKKKQMEKLQTIEILHPMSTASIRIPKIEVKKGMALQIEHMDLGYGTHKVVEDVSLEIQRGEHIAILGDNGHGKTTLLKTIVGEIPSLGGSMRLGSEVKLGYYAQHVMTMLDPEDNVKSYLEGIAAPELTPQDIFEMAGNFLFKDEALKKTISVLSGGEKARLCLAGLLLQKNDVLLLDEPTNHLDFETVEALANALDTTPTTVVFVSHNRTFVELLASSIVEVRNGAAKRYLGSYEEYVSVVEQRIDSQSVVKKENTSVKTGTKEEEKQKRILRRELQKNVQKVERQIEKVTEEKNEILQWFEVHYANFSQEKNQRLEYLHKKAEELEASWIEAQAKLDGME